MEDIRLRVFNGFEVLMKKINNDEILLKQKNKLSKYLTEPSSLDDISTVKRIISKRFHPDVNSGSEKDIAIVNSIFDDIKEYIKNNSITEYCNLIASRQKGFSQGPPPYQQQQTPNYTYQGTYNYYQDYNQSSRENTRDQQDEKTKESYINQRIIDIVKRLNIPLINNDNNNNLVAFIKKILFKMKFVKLSIEELNEYYEVFEAYANYGEILDKEFYAKMSGYVNEAKEKCSPKNLEQIYYVELNKMEDNIKKALQEKSILENRKRLYLQIERIFNEYDKRFNYYQSLINKNEKFAGEATSMSFDQQMIEKNRMFLMSQLKFLQAERDKYLQEMEAYIGYAPWKKDGWVSDICIEVDDLVRKIKKLENSYETAKNSKYETMKIISGNIITEYQEKIDKTNAQRADLKKLEDLLYSVIELISKKMSEQKYRTK